MPGKAAVSALAVGLSLAAFLSVAGTAPAGSPPDAPPIDEDLLRITKPKQNSIVRASLGRRVEISAACSDPCLISGTVHVRIGNKRSATPITPTPNASKSFSVKVALPARMRALLKRNPRPTKAKLRAVITAEVREGDVPMRTDTDARAVRLR